MPIGAVGGAILGAGALSAGASLIGSSQASSAAKNAANLQASQQATTRGDLLPFTQIGQNAMQSISDNQGLYANINNQYVDQAENYIGRASGYADQALNQSNAAQQLGQGPAGQAQLEALPGYQFTLAQGLQANQNAMAAKGLGVSGAAMKGAATYATGLANQTYGDQFNRLMQGANFTASTGKTYSGLADQSLNQNTGFQGNIQNSFNRLLNTAQLGENAASMTGTTGQAGAAAGGNFINTAGQAAAAGTVGVGNAATGGVNSFLTYNALQNLTGGGSAVGSNGGVNGNTDQAALLAAQNAGSGNAFTGNSGLGGIY
jgi:hypothetical protein